MFYIFLTVTLTLTLNWLVSYPPVQTILLSEQGETVFSTAFFASFQPPLFERIPECQKSAWYKKANIVSRLEQKINILIRWLNKYQLSQFARSVLV